MVLSLAQGDNQNLCRTSSAYSVILDLCVMPFDKALVSEKDLWCCGLALHCSGRVALTSVSLIAKRGFLTWCFVYFCIDIITMLGEVWSWVFCLFFFFLF